jgi:hypothetical protein
MAFFHKVNLCVELIFCLIRLEKWKMYFVIRSKILPEPVTMKDAKRRTNAFSDSEMSGKGSRS